MDSKYAIPTLFFLTQTADVIARSLLASFMDIQCRALFEKLDFVCVSIYLCCQILRNRPPQF